MICCTISEYIEEIVDADENVGVFLHHKEIANFVKEKFPSHDIAEMQKM